MSQNNDFYTDINLGRTFISYDGKNLLITRIDGLLFIEFNDGTRYGVGYLNDPLKYDDKTSIGIKTVAINKNTIILTKSYEHLYIGKFDMYDITNIEKVDDTFSKGNPFLVWQCKKNPYKIDTEIYTTIGFIDENNIVVLSKIIDTTTVKIYTTTVKIYIFNIQTDTWNIINDMEDTTTFNWIDNRMMFFLHIDKTNSLINLITIAINNDQIQKKTINVPDMTTLACSRQTKKLSIFDDTAKTLNVMLYKDLSDNNFERIEKIAEDNQTILEGVNELISIKKYFSLLKFDNFIFDPTVVRGLEYYTGPIFEANLTFSVKNNKGEEIEFGSIGGGGRYDDLVKRFNNQDCPSTGISVGLDRLIYAIIQKNKIKVEKKTPILICVFDEKYMDYYIKILNLLRTKNISAEIYSGSANIKSQLKYADKRGCNYVILCGDDEVSKNSVTIKNLEIGKQMSDSLKNRNDWKDSSRSQKTVALDKLLNEII